MAAHCQKIGKLQFSAKVSMSVFACLSGRLFDCL